MGRFFSLFKHYLTNNIGAYNIGNKEVLDGYIRFNVYILYVQHSRLQGTIVDILENSRFIFFKLHHYNLQPKKQTKD